MNARRATERFSTLVNDHSGADADLVAVTREFFAKGWNGPNFDPTVTTFDDLKATGNPKVIHGAEFREAIIVSPHANVCHVQHQPSVEPQLTGTA